jgi:S1/P1 Nuclease
MFMKEILTALTLCMLAPQYAFAWGDEGHKAVALIAEHYLTPDVRNTVAAMLAQDTDPLTQHDIASESTWADKYRNHHRETAQWHFVNIELDNPDIKAACFGRPPLPTGTLASNGPPQACVLDKINQFLAELSAPNIDPEEQLVALKFVLHFVGDMHQPLHCSDNHDRGGNSVKVIVDGFPHKSRDELHAFWDTQFVNALARSPVVLANQLLEQITPALKTSWEQGSVDDWAMEAFELSKLDAYTDSPLSKDAVQHLDSSYAAQAEEDAGLQLSRAGVRLAAVLNKALGPKNSSKGAQNDR